MKPPALFIEDGQGRLLRRWLNNGRPGNLSTMRAMRDLVRKDLGLDGFFLDEGLRVYAIDILRAFNAQTFEDRINALFIFVQKQILFVPDPTGGNDEIADAREVIKLAADDCDGKATLLATLLGMVGVQTSFKAARYSPNANGYQHVYVLAIDPKTNRQIPLDTTYVNSYPGWEARAIESVTLPVFTDTDATELDRRVRLGDLTQAEIARIIGGSTQAAGSAAKGNVTGAVVAGASLAVSFIPVVGPFLAPVVGLIAGLFHHGPTAEQRKLGSNFDVEDKQVAAYLVTLHDKGVNGTLTGSDVAEAASQVSQLAQLAQQLMQQDGSGYVKRQWEGSGSNIGEAQRYSQVLQFLADHVTPGSEGTAQTPGDPGSVAQSVGVGAGTAKTASTAQNLTGAVSQLLTVTGPSGEFDYGKLAIMAIVAFGAYKLIAGNSR